MVPTGHRTSKNTATTFSGLRGPLYGVVRHSFGAARQSLACEYYKTSEFRKPHLKSGNSSKTVYGFDAEFMMSICTLMSDKVGAFLHIFQNFS